MEGYNVTLDNNVASYYFNGGVGVGAKTVIGNTVTLKTSGDSSYDNIVGGFGGGYYYPADVLSNTVNIEGGRVTLAVGGESASGRVYDESTGYSTMLPPGNANGNTVNINGGEVKIAVGGMTEESGGLTLSAVSGSESSESGASASSNGNANGNFVNVNKGTVSAVAGGSTMNAYSSYGYADFAPYSATDGTANGNTVTITDGTIVNEVPNFVFDESTGNFKVETISVGGQIYGGISKVEADGNTVAINGGNVDNATIYGGAVYANENSNSASKNIVTISGDKTSAENAMIVGGGLYSSGVLAASGLSDGLSDSSEPTMPEVKADNNTVNVLSEIHPLAMFGGLAGFDSENYSIKTGSGNTLNVAAKGVTAYTVGGFQNMNFYLPSNIANGDTMLTIKTPASMEELTQILGGNYRMVNNAQVFEINKYDLKAYLEQRAAGDGLVRIRTDIDKDGNIINADTGEIIAKVKGTDLAGVTFGVAALKGVNLKKGDKVTLVKDENGLDTDPGELKTTSSEELGKAEFLQQNNMTTEEKYELSIKKEGDTAIVTTVDDIKENETSPDARKSPVETRMAVMTMINAGTDLLTGQGMANAEDAAGAAKDGSSSMFAAVSGGQLRAESGSHATTKGLGLNLGFAKEIKNKKGKLLFGPVLEYGHGNYDSYQDNGITADGKTSYWGLGIIAKQTNDNGFYYEGSVRVGRAKSDYGSDNVVENSHISYDSSATYWAAHLGAGMLKDIGHNNTLDYYGKYFYSHTGSDSTTIYRDGEDFDRVNFDGVNSNRIRVGARVTHALNERNKIYGGLAYQYEFSGEARATYRQGSAPSPSMKGSSGMIELGWQVKPGEKSPMIIDLGVTGWVGKQRGITANLQANWTF